MNTLRLSPRIFLICTFSLSPISYTLTWMWWAWPHHISTLPAFSSHHFLILPLNGCSDAVSRPQIYVSAVSHCLAFPLVLSSHVPLLSKFSTNPLFLRQHLYSPNRWEGYIYSVSLSDIHIHSAHVYFNTAQKWNTHWGWKTNKTADHGKIIYLICEYLH